jgi:glycosyltransferase involved in cell wall biosynthesis
MEAEQARTVGMADIAGAGGRGAGMSGRHSSRIALISGSSLCHNPRVVKAATTLAHAGYDVHVLGAWLDADLKARDQAMIRQAPFRFEPVYDVTLPGLHRTATHILRRARRKAANTVYGLTGRQSRDQLGYGIGPMLARARALDADLYIAHSEPALYVAWRLLRGGRRAGVDMEDWFSEDLLPEARRRRPLRLLRFLERELLVHGVYASCPSRVLSEALAKEYGGKPPIVLYNCFPWTDRDAIDGRHKDRRDTSVASICWYSQTLGPGRGIEDLVDALPLLKCDAEIHLRGHAAPGMVDWIRGRVPQRWQQRVFFHPLVANEELLSRIAEHDVGFAGEMPYCRSRDLTVTNKILHYLLGGLAVVASDTTGQREVAMQAKDAVAVYQSGNPAALAHALDGLLASHALLAHAKSTALQIARNCLCWEGQERTLLAAIAATLAV